MATVSEIAPGSVLAGFQVEGLVGRGGMGIVYRATQLSLSRQVALKIVNPAFAVDELLRERFLREAQLAASIDHPHVLPVYEAGEAEGTLFLAMRLIEGPSLAELLRAEDTLSPERAVRLATQLAQALQAAHEAGLLHRDVKPQNVLLSGSGESQHAYLCDFGLARRLAAGSLTREGSFLGTAAYAAPEQIRGDRLDARADLYALACLLYECLSGKPPFVHEDELALCWAHLHDAPPAPGSVSLTLARFDAFFARALAKDPGERFPSASAFAEAARAALASPGALSAAPAPRGRMRRYAAAIAFVGAAVVAVSVYLGTRSGSPPLVASPNSVAVIDPASDRLVTVIPVGTAPTTIVSGGGAVWTLNTGEQTISRIDASTRERTRTFSAGSIASDIAFADGAMWVADAAADTVSVLDQSGGVEATIKLGIHHRRRDFVPPRVALASGNGQVWATGGDLTTVVMDPGTRRVTRRTAGFPSVGADGSPAGPEIAVGKAGVWATDGRDELFRVDTSPAENVQLGGFGGDAGIEGVAVGRDAAWATGAGVVWQIRAQPARPSKTYPVGAGPAGIVLSPDSIWTANAFDGTISRIDIGSGETTTIAVGGTPNDLTFAHGLVWVTID